MLRLRLLRSRLLLLIALCLLGQANHAQTVTKTLGDDVITVQFPVEPVLSDDGTGYGVNLPDNAAPTARVFAFKMEMPFWVHYMFSRVPDMDPDFLEEKLLAQLPPNTTVIESKGVTLKGYPGVQAEVVIDPKRIDRKQPSSLSFSKLKPLPDVPLHMSIIMVLAEGDGYMVAGASANESPTVQAQIDDFVDSFQPRHEHTPGDADKQLESFGRTILGLGVLVLIVFVLLIVFLVKMIRRLRRRTV